MDDRELIRDFIDRDLYPENRFPRSIFPDLVSVLTDLFRRDSGTEIAGTSGTDELRERVREKVSLKALLDHNPGTLVLIYKTLITKYIYKRHHYKDDVEEVVQEIIARFLHDKIRGIRRRFDFENPELPTFTSYFLVTIRNIYIDILRKESRGRNLADSDAKIETVSDDRSGDMLSSLILEEEFRKFNGLMKLYYKSAPKLNLALKVKFNIPVDDADVLACFPDCTDEERQFLTGRSRLFAKNRKSMEKLVPVFNKYEGKSNNPDTLRKWISTRLEEIKRHMNRIHDKSPYNNSTISDLIILYFKWKRERGVFHDQ